MLNVAGGREAEIKDTQAQIIDDLQGVVDRLRSGDITANQYALILCHHRGESLGFTEFRRGRALETLGLIDVLRASLIAEMRAIET